MPEKDYEKERSHEGSSQTPIYIVWYGFNTNVNLLAYLLDI